MAANTARNLNAHYGRLATSTQRLSSGLRVNSAADDAAGLAIRELQRADIASFHQGARNANDAISMIQVADGALGIIDEKLIRMKELAEQAATGTYSSTQRLMIDSEFQAMASEIDRIANATDFNGIHLLDGSLSGVHNGSGLVSKGAMKIHFGTANDSAEDYYYVEIGDCTTKGLGLHDTSGKDEYLDPIKENENCIEQRDKNISNNSWEGTLESEGFIRPPLNDSNFINNSKFDWDTTHSPDLIPEITAIMPKQGQWYIEDHNSKYVENFMAIIPKGSVNVIINQFGARSNGRPGDNDLQLFTKDGKHLAGTPLDDVVFRRNNSIKYNSDRLGFTEDQYDNSYVNYGPKKWDEGRTLNFTIYGDMTIGWSGDGERTDKNPNDGRLEASSDYEILTIDKVTEDLIIWNPGIATGFIQYYIDYQGPPAQPSEPAPKPDTDPTPTPGGDHKNEEVSQLIDIKTQEKAQKTLTRINDAIIKKDKIRAHLGALQNRLENTVCNLNIQAENLQAAESRISDVDVATEMTEFVRNQILTQSATAMLSQANNMPQMMMQLIVG